MASIIFLILLIVFFIAVAVVGMLTRTLISKKTFFFAVPIFLIVWGLYILGYRYSRGFFDFTALLECFSASLKAFTFEIKRDYVAALIADDPIYKIDIYSAVVLSGTTLISSGLGFCKMFLVNVCRRLSRSLFRSPDIVVGFNDHALEYCRKNRGSILWIDPKVTKVTDAERRKLYYDGIAYFLLPFCGKNVKKAIAFTKETINFICFQENGERNAQIFEVLETLKTFDQKRLAWHVETDAEHAAFVGHQLAARCDGCKNSVMATTFDIYELMARRFSARYNLARLLPRDFLENGAVKPDKEINVVMIGFGKTASAVFRSVVLNNQFVEVHEGKYRCKPIRFYLYDKEKRAFDRSLPAYIEHYADLCRIADGDVNALPPFEMTAQIHHTVSDVRADVSAEFVQKFHPKANEFTVFFVCLDQTLENMSIAEQLSLLITKEQGAVFYNTDSAAETLGTKAPHVFPFGFKNEVLTHDHIVDDKRYGLAEFTNVLYHQKKKDGDVPFESLPVFERLSNIYHDINLTFKLNVLGFDTAPADAKNAVDQAAFFAVYDPQNDRGQPPDYSRYQQLNTRNAMAYQEHLRWCMFYFVNGFRGMRLDEVTFNKKEGKPVHKDLERKRHACLTSFEGLDRLHRAELELYRDCAPDRAVTIEEIETYRYDLQLLDDVYGATKKGDFAIVPLAGSQ